MTFSMALMYGVVCMWDKHTLARDTCLASILYIDKVMSTVCRSDNQSQTTATNRLVFFFVISTSNKNTIHGNAIK